MREGAYLPDGMEDIARLAGYDATGLIRGANRSLERRRAVARRSVVVFLPRLPVGEWGGHLLVDCDDPLAVHKVCSTFPAFEFQARPVIAVEDAVRVELEAIAWRDGLKRS